VAGWSTLGGRDERAAVVPFWIAGAGLVFVTTAAWIFVIASSGGDSMDMVPSAVFVAVTVTPGTHAA